MMSGMTDTAPHASRRAALVERVRAGRLPPPAERRAIREAAHVTLRELGNALGVHEATAQKWERGTVRPRPTDAIAYRELLDGLRAEVDLPARASCPGVDCAKSQTKGDHLCA